jgi:hypothetical protein
MNPEVNKEEIEEVVFLYRKIKKHLIYIRILALCAFVFIMLEQQFDFYSQIVPASKTIVRGGDWISQREQLFNSIKKILPLKGIYRYEKDSSTNDLDFFITQYTLVPRIITDKLLTDTVVGYFPKTLSINNPQNPLFLTRTHWTILADNGTGELLLKNK